MQTLQNGQYLALIDNNTKAVAIINGDGTGAGTVNLQEVSNTIVRITNNLAATNEMADAIKALGLTLPEAN
jgi:hypothetical protein